MSVRENQSPTKLLSDIKPGYWVNPFGWHVVIVTGKQLGAFTTHTISNTLRNFNPFAPEQPITARVDPGPFYPL